MASSSTRIDYLKQRIEKHKDQLNSRLMVETEMLNINRDYDTISGNYRALLQRREQARMSEKVDAETVSIKFKTVDPPKKPLAPSSPKRLLLLSGVLFMGLGAGFGLALLYFLLKPTYMTARQLREVTGLPVLGIISEQVLDGSKNTKGVFMFAFILLGLIFVYLGFMSFEYMRLKDIDPFNLIRNKLLS